MKPSLPFRSAERRIVPKWNEVGAGFINSPPAIHDSPMQIGHRASAMNSRWNDLVNGLFSRPVPHPGGLRKEVSRP
jgi:hypothetical protein